MPSPRDPVIKIFYINCIRISAQVFNEETDRLIHIGPYVNHAADTDFMPVIIFDFIK